MIKSARFLGYLIFWVCFSASVSAGPLPDTGQHTAGRITPGEDAACLINPRSYVKLDIEGKPVAGDGEWAFAKDLVTGLVWEIKTEDPESLHYWKNAFTWQEANELFLKRINEGRYGGSSDWRLPTVKELATILDRGAYLPSVSKEYFPHTESLGFWTATPDAADENLVWRVHFCRGYMSPVSRSDRLFMRAVRGPLLETGRFSANGDGTVTDTATGLMWHAGPPEKLDWQQALKYCENLEFAGYDDWRLPNAVELQSIADYTRKNPVLDTSFFKGMPSTEKAQYEASLWSSTFYASNDGSAWLMHTMDGSFFHHRKTYDYYVLGVRGGQKILDSRLVIKSPSQGSSWKTGEKMNIEWKSGQNSAGKAEILLSREGGKEGSFKEVLASGIASDEPFAWIVQGAPSNNCLLQIIPENDPGKAATQGLFQILGQ